MVEMKHYKALFIGAIISAAISMLCGYQFGKQDAMTDIRQEYPEVYNFKKEVNNVTPVEIGDIWITDGGFVHVWTDTGWAINIQLDLGLPISNYQK